MQDTPRRFYFVTGKLKERRTRTKEMRGLKVTDHQMKNNLVEAMPNGGRGGVEWPPLSR